MQEQLKVLIEEKDKIEGQMAEIVVEVEQLDEIKGFSKGLVDQEGFPRNDLDFGEISHYRNLKRRKAELNNDHFALMQQIQKAMFSLHSTFPKLQTETTQPKKIMEKNNPEKKQKTQIGQKMQIEEKPYVIEYLTPFAKISSVAGNSPAQSGGVKCDDLLSEFEHINIYTLDNVKQIPTVVKEGQPLKLVLMRRIKAQNRSLFEKVFELKDNNLYAKLELKITPNRWQGRGLLGCKIDHL